MLEEASEQDEQEDVGRRNQRRDAVDALGAEIKLADDLIEAVAPVCDRGRQVLSEEPVGQERCADDRQRETQHASGRLEHQHDDDGADDEVGEKRLAALDQLRFEYPVVERQREGDDAEDRIVPGDPMAVGLAVDRIDEEREQQQKPDVQRARDEARKGTERGDDELVARERERDTGDDLPRRSLQLALDAGFVEGGFGYVRRKRLQLRAGHHRLPGSFW